MAQKERPVRSAEASVYSFATEDEARVRRALTNILGGAEAETEEAKLTGHYEDPIISITVRIAGRSEATELLRRIFSELTTLQQTQVVDELPDRVDESGDLYLRLDKQAALLGKIRLTDGDPIRVKFKVQLPHGADPVEYVRVVLCGEGG